MRSLIFLLSLVFIVTNADASQTVYGVVKSKDKSSPLPGASVRVVGTQRGTYANRDGLFKLQIHNTNKELLIKYIGYKSQNVSVSSLTDTLKIFLEPERVLSGKAIVYGDIEPNILIERAIARKNENSKKIKTVMGKLQTKLYIDASETLVPSADDNSMSISLSAGEEKKEPPKKSLMETISMTYKDYDKNIYHSNILSRRQTKNVPAQFNQVVLSEFINFYDDRIEFGETQIVSPLANDALDYYKYKITDKQVLDGKYIYFVDVIPSTTLYPTFDGQILISEGDYDMVGVDLTPSSHTAITFFKNIRFQEKFEKYKEDLWYPGFLQFDATIGANILAGVVEINVDATVTSIYSELKLNEALPDSIYEANQKYITVSPLADSTDKDYWQDNSLFSTSQEDEKIYAEIDSMVVESDSLEQQSDFSYNITPFLDFNRAFDVSYGLTPSVTYGATSLTLDAYYSTGLKDFMTSVYLNNTFAIGDISFNAEIGYYQKAGTFSDDKSSPRLLNTIHAGLFARDYYDYFKEDAFKVKLDMKYQQMQLGLAFAQSQQESVGVNTSRYAFGDNDWRANPKITSTEFQTLNYNLSFGSKGLFGIGATPYYLGVYGVIGKDKDQDKTFSTWHAEAKATIPLFETGYTPIEFSVAAQAAMASEETPAQYQLRLQNNIGLQKSMLGLYSAPLAYYGGSELYSSTVSLNFSDFLWRAIGLPVYNGRGLNLSFIGSAVYTYTNSKSYYISTGDKGYLEAGFHIGRIPSIFSDVIFFGFDFRKQIDGSNTGWGISVSAPF